MTTEKQEHWKKVYKTKKVDEVSSLYQPEARAYSSTSSGGWPRRSTRRFWMSAGARRLSWMGCSSRGR